MTALIVNTAVSHDPGILTIPLLKFDSLELLRYSTDLHFQYSLCNGYEKNGFAERSKILIGYRSKNKLVTRIFLQRYSLFLRFQQNYFQICIQQNVRSLSKIVLFVGSCCCEEFIKNYY